MLKVTIEKIMLVSIYDLRVHKRSDSKFSFDILLFWIIQIDELLNTKNFSWQQGANFVKYLLFDVSFFPFSWAL